MLENPAVDVRCERCQTEYELEDSSVSEEGTQVQCMACGHTFLVTHPAPGALVEPDSPPPAEWLLETSDGQAHRFRNLTSLQKWIIERKVTREDRISRTGHAWRRLGEIVELEPFFDVVDEADKARAAALTGRTNPLRDQAQAARRSSPVRGVPIGRTDELRPTPIGSSEHEPLDEMDPDRPEMQTAVVRLGGSNVLKLLVVLVVAALVAYVGITQFWKRPPTVALRPLPPPPAVKVPPAPIVVPTPTPPRTPPPAPPPVVATPEPKTEPAPPPVSFEKLIADADRQLENGSSEKARGLYERALKLKPGAAQALAGLGYVALDHGRTPQAFSLFKRALAQKPDFGPAVFGLAEAHRTTGDEEIALSHYRRYIAVDPGGTDVPAARQHIKTLEARLAARGSAVSQPPPSP